MPYKDRLLFFLFIYLRSDLLRRACSLSIDWTSDTDRIKAWQTRKAHAVQTLRSTLHNQGVLMEKEHFVKSIHEICIFYSDIDEKKKKNTFFIIIYFVVKIKNN